LAVRSDADLFVLFLGPFLPPHFTRRGLFWPVYEAVDIDASNTGIGAGLPFKVIA